MKIRKAVRIPGTTSVTVEDVCLTHSYGKSRRGSHEHSENSSFRKIPHPRSFIFSGRPAHFGNRPSPTALDGTDIKQHQTHLDPTIGSRRPSSGEEVMKHSLHVALRVGVCVAMATTSVAAFAGEQDETSAKTDRDEQMQPASVSPNTDLTPTKYDEAEGAGGGEPAGAQARMQADARFKDKAAIQAYNQEKFLEQSWMAAP